MQFNQFSMYSYKADDLKDACDDKFLVSITKLNSIHELEEVRAFLINTFGNFEDDAVRLDCPNNLSVYIQNLEDQIIVEATQNDKQIFGKRWRLETTEEVKKRLENNKK